MDPTSETAPVPADAVVLDEAVLTKSSDKAATKKWLFVGILVIFSLVTILMLVLWLFNNMNSGKANDSGELDLSLTEIASLQDDIDFGASELDGLDGTPAETELDTFLNDLDAQLDDINNNTDLSDFQDP
jgi:hypothetical protein